MYVFIYLEKDNPSDVDATNANADPWGVAGAIEAFNVLEYCVRYTDRLSKEIYAAVCITHHHVGAYLTNSINLAISGQDGV
jgi:hypothetical protein